VVFKDKSASDMTNPREVWGGNQIHPPFLF